jgi:hypothetical protein
MYSPVMYWGNRGELPQSSIFTPIPVKLGEGKVIEN